MKRGAQIAIVLLIALAVTVLPGGGGAVNVLLTVLSLAFFTALALAAYRFYFRFRFDLDALGDRQRGVLWGALGLTVLTFCASSRMFDSGGFGVLAWFALLGIASYGFYWVWTQYRNYA